ncbi:MAG: endolytic transglycosylase MltG [Acidobacteriota bacterium]|nr:endolytic transglycosylase MltG [Acidobacteriota bacterium]
MRRLGTFFLLVLFAAGTAAGWLAYEWRTPYQGYSGEAAVVDVPRGVSTRGIAERLERAGVVRSALAFEIWSRWHHEQRLEAGEYRFDRPMPMTEVFDAVAAGRVWTVTLTVPEGWTMFDIADAVAKEGLASRAAFLRAARNPAPIRDLAPNAPTLEGFLFPATYQFPHRTTAPAVVDAMVRRFRQAWSGLAANDPAAGNLNPEQVVTLASLVQEETPKEDERPIIAGVFANRLRLGYPLECDPSVVYALKMEGKYDGELRPGELRTASPYNTYLHYGLPPGPIGNPGIPSLEAALHPAKVDYLYFVANGSGGHSFSKTLAGHERNIERYRKLIEQERQKGEEGKGEQRPDPGRGAAAHSHRHSSRSGR